MENKPSMEMPKYQCHKQVWALKIKSILYTNRTGTSEPSEESLGRWAEITPADERYAPFFVDEKYTSDTAENALHLIDKVNEKYK